MALKYKFNWKDLKLEDFKIYLLALFKSILPKKRIKNIDDLAEFIQKKSAWVAQVTLLVFLKTGWGRNGYMILVVENFFFLVIILG